MKGLYNIYIVPDVYYRNKYEIIVYTDIRILYKSTQTVLLKKWYGEYELRRVDFWQV